MVLSSFHSVEQSDHFWGVKKNNIHDDELDRRINCLLNFKYK